MRRSDRAVALAAAGACALLTAVRLGFHELWRDEAWLWLVARESPSLAELHAQLGRSGQGYLFSWLCWLVARGVSSPWGLQVLQLATVTTAAFLFVRWAPLPRSTRLLFVAGYFPFYEYAVLSRHYGLGMALLWASCAAATAPRGELLLGLSLGIVHFFR